jgi:hypothetical protein
VVTGTSTPTTLHAGRGGARVDVRAASSPLTIDGDNGPDTISVGSQAPGLGGTLANITAPVTVTDTSALSTLSVDDSGDGTGRAGTISGTAITGLGMGPDAAIYYNGSRLASLTVRGGAGWNFFDILSTTAPLFLMPGAGHNSVWIGDNDSLDGIAGAITIEGSESGGQNSLVIDDHNDSGRSATLTSSAITFTGVPTITYDGLDSLDLVGTSGHNTITVNSVPGLFRAVTIWNVADNTLTGPAVGLVTWYSGLPPWDWVIIVP